MDGKSVPNFHTYVLIFQTGYFSDRLFLGHAISWTGYFLDRLFLNNKIHTAKGWWGGDGVSGGWGLVGVWLQRYK